MDITFNISKGNLIALREQFDKDAKVLEAAAFEIRENIMKIDRVLSPMQSMTIESDNYLNFVGYKVTRTYVQGAPTIYECQCYSFKYQSGTDADGFCKHIRKAKERGL